MSRVFLEILEIIPRKILFISPYHLSPLEAHRGVRG
jgi:hypothetical protein